MLALLLLSAMLVASGRATDFTLCSKDTNSAIESVEVAGCDGPGTCSVSYGEMVGITVTFTPTIDAKVVYADFGLYFSSTFKICGTVNPKMACEGGVTCPVSAGESYTYTGEFPAGVNSKKDFKGYFRLAKIPEEDGVDFEEIGCVVIPFQIKKDEPTESSNE